jgi:carbonic anhydrase
VVIDSIEYAVSHFDAHIIVVLGHCDCGAVAGALKHLQKNGGATDKPCNHLCAVLIPIEQAIVQENIDVHASNALEKSIEAQVKYSANQLMVHSPRIYDAVQNGQIMIVGAQYFLNSGKVEELFTISQSTKD